MGKYDNVIAALKDAKAELPEYRAVKNISWGMRKADVTKAIRTMEELYGELFHAKPYGSADAVIGTVCSMANDWRNYKCEDLGGDCCLAPVGYVVFVTETLDAWIKLYEEANYAE